MPSGSLARLRASAPPGTLIETVTFAELLDRQRDMPGGFVVIDPDGWHVEGVVAVARRTGAIGGRLVIYSTLTPSICRYIKGVAAEVTPEVILGDTDDSFAALRAVLRRYVMSVPAMVLARLAGPLERLAHPVGSYLISYLGWAPIPATVGQFCEGVDLSGKATLVRLHSCGLGDTDIVLEVTRVARACQHLFSGLAIPAAAHLACFGSERAMRDAFRRQLAATPSAVRRGRNVNEVAELLVAAATCDSC